LDIKIVEVGGENYIVSAGQDGTIIKWHMNEDFRYLSSNNP
jgi:hypothetical protein